MAKPPVKPQRDNETSPTDASANKEAETVINPMRIRSDEEPPIIIKPSTGKFPKKVRQDRTD
jgi:hypothetical protein